MTCYFHKPFAAAFQLALHLISHQMLLQTFVTTEFLYRLIYGQTYSIGKRLYSTVTQREQLVTVPATLFLTGNACLVLLDRQLRLDFSFHYLLYKDIQKGDKAYIYYQLC